MSEIADFQIVTENIASTLEPNVRVVEYISPSWNILIVFIAMIFMVLNKQLYAARFRVMLFGLLQTSDSEKMTREWNPITSINGLTIFLSYVAVMAIIVQKIILVFSENPMFYDGFGFYLDICSFIMAYLIIQYLFVTFYGWLFPLEAATTHQEVMHLSTMTMLTIIMIVFGLVVLFYPTKIILIITSAIILIITAFRIIKTFFEFQILSKRNLFNIFLYFCTLEIIPLSVAVMMLCRLIVTDCVL